MKQATRYRYIASAKVRVRERERANPERTLAWEQAAAHTAFLERHSLVLKSIDSSAPALQRATKLQDHFYVSNYLEMILRTSRLTVLIRL